MFLCEMIVKYRKIDINFDNCVCDKDAEIWLLTCY